MDILLLIHSIVRWVLVLAGLAALVKMLVGWLASQSFERVDRILVSVFSGVMDLQVLLGLILIIWGGLSGDGFPRHRIEHAITMILALIAAHMTARWKLSEDKIRFRNSFLAILVALILVFLGVMVLPGGWTR